MCEMFTSHKLIRTFKLVAGNQKGGAILYQQDQPFQKL